jgi:hypothetical protein
MGFSGSLVVGRMIERMRSKTMHGGCSPINETRFENSIQSAQTGYARAKMPPYYCSTLTRSIFAEWGLVKAKIRRGVFRVKIMMFVRVPAQR